MIKLTFRFLTQYSINLPLSDSDFPSLHRTSFQSNLILRTIESANNTFLNFNIDEMRGSIVKFLL